MDYLIHNNWAQQNAVTTYSASAIERATKFFFLAPHEIRDEPKN